MSFSTARYVGIYSKEVFIMLNWLREWWSYSAYDDKGMLKLLLDRDPDPDCFNTVKASSEEIQWTLATICASFDIDLAQRFCLRPDDNLAGIYAAMTKYRIGDDMEYERLLMSLSELVGERCREPFTDDINVTVREVIEYLSRNRVEDLPA